MYEQSTILLNTCENVAIKQH